MNIQNRKQSAIILLFIFVFSFTLSIAVPKKAEAQFVVFDPSTFGIGLQDSIWTKLQKVATTVWNKVASVAFTNALRGFATSLAQDSANYLAEGGAGRKSLMQKKPWDTYFKDAGKAATAQFLDDVASGALNLDVCQPPTVGLNLSVAMSMKTAEVTGNKPRCSLDDIYKKWGDWGKNVVRDPLSLATLNGQSLKDVATAMGLNPKAEMTPQEEARLKAELLSKSFSFQGSDVEFINDTKTENLSKENDAKYKAEVSSAGYKEIMGSKTAITGELKTPAQYGDSKLKELTDANKNFVERTEDIAVDTLNIFANTFITKRLERFVKEQLAKSTPPQDDTIPINTTLYSPTVKTKSIVDEAFAVINTISLNINPRSIDIISEMEMDLGSDFRSKINNGTIDSKFADALRRAETDPLSLQEARDNNLIDDRKFFGFTNITNPNPEQPTDGSVITYENIKKLRRNRVVPVGWELAALKVKELGQSGALPEGCSAIGCTLAIVMDGFNKTGSFTVGNTTIKDEYCGWRSIESYLSYSALNSEDGQNNTCSSQYFNLGATPISGLKFKRDDNHCYKYTTDSDGVVVSRVDEYVSGMTKQACENDIGPTHYREWVDGGCFAIEENESPFCHLVDPNWILKAPEQQCASEGYYSALESVDSSNRYKDCADIKNCIKTNDNGDCLGYGYCLKEKNIWRFRGDSCSEKFAGCSRLKDDMGQTQSYILGTLKNCSESEAGCKSYSIYQKQDESIIATSTYHWDESYSGAYTATTPYKTILLNKNSKTCDKNSDGCSKFIELKPGANLIPNGSFEINEDNNTSAPDGWSIDNAVYQFGAGNNAIDGIHSVKLNDKGVLLIDSNQTPFNLLNKGLYTLSYYVKKASNGEISVTPKLIYTISGYSQEVKINNDAKYFSNENADSSGWIRKTGYFSIHNSSTNALSNISLMFEVSGNSSVYIDAVQLEINKYIDSNIDSGIGEANAYNDYGKVGSVYFKKAPEYYNCSASNKNDTQCAPYIKYCDAKDNGCEAYRPTNGDPLVSAVPEQDDLCPSECNNYQTFSQQPSYFESIEQAQFVVSLIDKSFIPESAKDCPANEESCELFTNIDKLEKGAEAKEYYSFVRQCVKPQEALPTIYYTWEGSDTSGFQLKTWKLLEGVGGAPCTNVVIGGNSCNATLDANISDCNPDTDYDCRIFYDKNAEPHYRLLSKTIPITEECIDLRREGSENNPKQIYKTIPSLSKSCSASNVGCRKYKGNKSDNVRNVFTEGFEAGTISGWGSTNILGITSEAIAYNGHSMSVRGTGQITITYNITDSGYVINPNRQYVLSFWAKKHDGNWIASSKMFSNTIGKIINGMKGLFYKDVKAVGSSTSLDSYEFDVSNGDVYIDFPADNKNISDSSDWLMYKYNAVLSPQVGGNGKYFLKFTVNVPSGANGFFIDNINLKEITADFYKVKDSWDTPNICSSKPYIGCSKYQDKSNQSWYFYKFSNLCKAENIGCTAMIDTKNSDMPYQQTFNAYCKTSSSECQLGKYYYKNNEDININNRVTSTIKVAQDNLVYVIKDSKYLCNSSNKGCSKMGFLGDASGYTDVYKINNPDTYITDDFYGGSDQTLCLSENKDCVGFSKSDGGVVYKIHPRDLTCEYKEKDGDNPAGFYKKGTTESCDNLLYNENYNTFVNNANNVSDNYLPFSNSSNKYAALCPDDQDKCSLFIDPNDNVDEKDIVKQEVNQNINFANNVNWRYTKWTNGLNGSLLPVIVSPFSPARVGDSLKIVVPGSSLLRNYDSMVYSYDFSVEPGEIYALSANVQMDGNINTSTNVKEYITTFLSCKPISSHNYNTGYLNSFGLPYAYPSIRSNYAFEEKSGDHLWHNINGLYKIAESGAYCNVVFNFHGASESNIYIKDIKFQKINGAYYYKDNDNLDRSSCRNNAGVEDGCILFNNTSIDGFTSNSTQSYSQGRLIGNDPQYLNDTNDLLKVIRDRECGEWATCASQITTKNPQNGEDQYSCTSLIACNKLSEDKSGVCDNYLVRDGTEKPLTLDYYHKTMGKATWGDMSYSGYSILGNYPVDSLSSFKLEDGSYSLGRKIVKQIGNTVYNYKIGVGVESPLLGYTGLNDYVNTRKEKSCRLYPEKDSPFTLTSNNAIATYRPETTDGKTYAIFGGGESSEGAFSNANICQPSEIVGTTSTCDCSYIKANYGVNNLYFPYEYDNIPERINIGGMYDEAGNEVPSYSKLKKTTKSLGWSGYCLDYDKSPNAFIGGSGTNSYQDPDKFNYRCSTWYPVDLISGELNSTTYAPQADVASKLPVNGNMCMVAEDYVTTEPRVYCGYFDYIDSGIDAGITASSTCTVLIYVPAGAKVSKDVNLTTLEELTNGNHWLTNFSISNISGDARYQKIDPPIGPNTGTSGSYIYASGRNSYQLSDFNNIDYNNGGEVVSENNTQLGVSWIHAVTSTFVGVPFQIFRYDELVDSNYHLISEDPRQYVANANGIYVNLPGLTRDYGVYQYICGAECDHAAHYANEDHFNTSWRWYYEWPVWSGGGSNEHRVAGHCSDSNENKCTFESGSTREVKNLYNPGPTNYYVHITEDPNYTITSSASTEYLKKCKTYATVGATGANRTIFKANTFYLNSLSIADFLGVGTNPCIYNGQELCVHAKSGRADNYNISVPLRHNWLWLNGNQWFETIGRLIYGITGLPDYGTILYNNNNQAVSGTGNFSIFFADLAEGISTAKQRLQNLIIKIKSTNFHTNGGSISVEWNDIPKGSSNNGTSVIQPFLTGTTTSGQLGFAVEGVYGENRKIQGKSSANIKIDFYAYANADRTPIREIKICWDGVSDGNCMNPAIFTGPFKNRKDKCERRCGIKYQDAFPSGTECSTRTDCPSNQQCFAKTWGDTEDACVEDTVKSKAYFSFSHVYSCSKMDPVHYISDCSQYDNNAIGGCCVYTPIVKVKDNWNDDGGESTYGMCGANNATACHIIIIPKP